MVKAAELGFEHFTNETSVNPTENSFLIRKAKWNHYNILGKVH